MFGCVIQESGMRQIAALAVLMLAHLQASLQSQVHPEILAERRAVVKRLAEADEIYTDHDVATVLHERAPNSFHRISRRDLRAVTDDETTQRLRLESASGSILHLRLQKRSLFSPDTQFIDHIHGERRVKRASPPQDCYATGDMEADGMSDGFVSVATCDGMLGTAFLDDTEYYIHPVAHAEGEHQVHILSRRFSDDVMNYSPDAEVVDDETDPDENGHDRPKRCNIIMPNTFVAPVTEETYKTATSFVMEMAIFLDEHFWMKMQKVAPGREHERLFTSWSAVNALYSNKDKVGYDAHIKIKLFEIWVVDPVGYPFKQDLLANLKSSCKYTRNIYKYDIHYLFTGVSEPKDSAVGRAYRGGVCTNARCGASYGWGFQLISHEIGHSLGFRHHSTAHCPDDIKAQGGGFMGGGHPIDFSPCNKWELHNFFSEGKGQCLFEETGEVTTSEEYVNLPRLFDGQHRNPAEWCQYRFGEDYELYRPYDFHGDAACVSWMCINRNESSPEYLQIKRSYARYGYTCDNDKFCDRATCEPWDKPGIGWDPSLLREAKGENYWSEWTREWTTCSKTCGKGVQIKTRRCIFSGVAFLSPHCRGVAIRVRVCNEDPCPGHVMTIKTQRRIAGDAVCDRFHKNNASLSVREGSIYLPKSRSIFLWSKIKHHLQTTSCLLMCVRSPARYNYIDSFYPDGTPCYETDLTTFQLERFNVAPRCVQGVCMEFSDCPDNAKKDVCGVCGGDPTRCVNERMEKSGDVPASGQSKIVATLPVGTRNIDIGMIRLKGHDGVLELWNSNGDKIIGVGGLYGNSAYEGDTAVSHANTTWAFRYKHFIRADGPIDQGLVIKARRQTNPITEIYVTYLLP